MRTQTELTLSRPQLLPLSPEREQAAIRLLAELVLDELAKRRSRGSDKSGGGSGVVVPFPTGRARTRKAA